MVIDLFSQFHEALSFEFMRNALIAGAFIAVSCAVVGVFLVLRRFATIGDGLAHVTLTTVALGLMLGITPIALSIPLVIIASLLILRLSEKTAMWGDSAIAFVSSVSVALAIMIASVSGGFNVDFFSYLFGSILAITATEVVFSILLSVMTIGVVIFLYRDLFSLTFDEDFAQVSGVRVRLINGLLVSLTGVTVVLGVRLLGTMLISSLIVIPAITALQIGSSFKHTLIIAVIVALFSVIFGIFISFVADVPTGATIVLANTALFLGAYFFRKIIS